MNLCPDTFRRKPRDAVVGDMALSGSKQFSVLGSPRRRLRPIARDTVGDPPEGGYLNGRRNLFVIWRIFPCCSKLKYELIEHRVTVTGWIHVIEIIPEVCKSACSMKTHEASAIYHFSTSAPWTTHRQ